MWKWIKSSGIGPMAGALMAASLLAGCASTVTSQVTAFRQPGWTDNPPRTYAFEHTAAQQNDLERQTYEAWTSDQLAAHGFTSVPRASARYVVRLDYSTATRLVQVRQPVYPDPYWGPGPWGPWRSPWGPWGPWGPQYVDTNVQVPFYAYHVEIDEAATGKRVYQVTAQTQGGDGSLTAVMPYLVRSAFANFPAPNAQPILVELPVDPSVKPAAKPASGPAPK
ncbi:hypothetical protein P3T32_002686 [Ralstonia sp. GP73]|jgi:hypothetical protein|uniref:DUF4136 domain-containing protein n=2 Tax=Ralstonia TaxID=48736 RepID=A0AAD2BNS5_9RALS|nr:MULTISPECIES: DUF4136 domain-containing protein [Ralstonia]EFP65108.1 hypothetical protein HMPREF1004_03155 [Ralstonia pickettii]EGY63206.1 hypothetical protein HMPREF0989_03228 [Ralstonia sp. 5_2_56FAA]MBT2177081.1 DUF4136 domain-containing protein [Ralstonia pickettii]MDH6642834.1 hypothetical protein [Ralstonia sp. GP73]NPT48457.1 DUF4136 domain-containing protein [Ralstonia sp. 3N]